MRAWCAILSACFALMPAQARAYVPEQTPHRAVDAGVRRALADPDARGTIDGVAVVRGGRLVYGLNANRAMAPASVMKLATMTAAMVRFGPGYRFLTRAFVPRGSGTAPRALYMVGGGDPTLATEAYRRFRFLPKSGDVIKRPAFAHGSPTIEQLASRIRAAGVRVVRGDLIADESLFDSVRTQAGWLPRYLKVDPDSGLLSALVANEGRADLKGKILVPSPAIHAGTLLKQALRARGVTVTGNVRIGKTQPGTVEAARVASPPLREITDFTLRYSINFCAELLLKSLGARFGGAGSTAAGVSVVRSTLKGLGVPLAGMRQTDGSGLSVLDRITPRAVSVLLDRIVTRAGAGWDALRASVPVAGEPGTLLHRMTGPPTGGNLRGKTGQIPDVRAMAGWVTASDGIPVVYVMMFNRAPHPFALTDALDLFGTLLALLPAA